jgi:iron complex outermembrane recepter protein
VNLWADNLADKRALASFQGTSAVGSRTGLRAMYVTPRTVGLNVSYNFK